MIFKKVHNNDSLSYILVPVFLLVFWIKSLGEGYVPESFGDIAPMPLWGMVLKVMKGSRFVASFIVVILALLSAIGVNRFVNRYRLLNKPTFLAGVVYILLVSGFVEVQYIQPVWFFVPLLLLSVEKLFIAHGKHKPMAYSFDAALWFSVGTLFFGKGLFFYLFILIVMYILRVFTLRSILASLLGLILPYVFAFTYYFVTDKMDLFEEIMYVNLFSPVAFFSHSVISKIYVFMMVILVLFALINVARQMPSFKIFTRKQYRVFNWLVILSLIAAMTPFYSVEMIPVVSIGSSIVIAHFLDTTRPYYLQDVFFTALAVITLLAQIYI